MNVTPELVRAEMDYRVERALAEAVVVEVRAARRSRSRGLHLHRRRHHERRTEVNRAALAA
ncbi:MAG TPA: hypothetical protein VNP92_27005 [Actinophytocola sp.]|nr:hypothetical protein [Actinophytocola sp.]